MLRNSLQPDPDSDFWLDPDSMYMDLKHCLDASSVQVMNAGPLPLNPYLTYRPHDSFDERGYLRPEAYEAKVSEYVRQRQYNPGT